MKICGPISSAPILFCGLCTITLVACSDPGSAPVSDRSLGEQAAALEGDDGDAVFVGDNVDNSVKRFDVNTGHCLGDFVPANGGGTRPNPINPTGPSIPILKGPKGLVISRGIFFVVGQNSGLTPLSSEVLRYDLDNGDFMGQLTPPCNADLDSCTAPFAARGAVLLRHMPTESEDTMFVTDVGSLNPARPLSLYPGRVTRINARTGAMLPDLLTLPSSVGGDPELGQIARQIVQGPDGMLYVSVWTISGKESYVLRVDPNGGAPEYIISSGLAGPLHLPDALTFGPDGRLYISCFLLDPSSATTGNDKILVYEPTPDGSFVQRADATIHLDLLGANPRAISQGIVFGRGGYLYATVVDLATQLGEVRYYDVNSRMYGVFSNDCPAPANDLRAPFLLTTRHTDSATFAFGHYGQSQLPASSHPALNLP